jgi:hypothetical protein
MEQLLPGGFVNAVIRVGDTVRRPPSPNAGFVHDLLDHLERHGWTGAPRYLGTDADGREILSFLEGHVAWEDRQPAEVSSDESLAEVARLARQLHDLTAGTPLAGPGDRLHDVAHVCWQFLPLGPAAGDLDAAARRLRLVCDSYGLEDRTGLVDTILWWQDRCWRGIEARAASGDPAMRRLRDRGTVRAVWADHAWVTAHRERLEAAVA